MIRGSRLKLVVSKEGIHWLIVLVPLGWRGVDDVPSNPCLSVLSFSLSFRPRQALHQLLVMWPEQPLVKSYKLNLPFTMEKKAPLSGRLPTKYGLGPSL